MSHTVSGKITRAPKIQQGQNNNGQYTAFFFEISEFIKGYGQEENSYTNYSIAFFPKTQGAIDFHTQAIQEGAFVVVSCEKLKIDISNPDYPKLKMDNARLENFFNPSKQSQQQNHQQQRQQPAPQQQAPQMAPAYQPVPQQAPAPQQMQQQQAQQQYQAPANNFDDGIPFAPIGLQYPALLLSM